MGVRRTDYVVLGSKFDYKEFKRLINGDLDGDGIEEYEDNPYSEKIGGKKGITFISDGMNGEYVVIGKVLIKSSQEYPIDMQVIHGSNPCEEGLWIEPSIEKIILTLQIKNGAPTAGEFRFQDCLPPVKILAFSHYC